MKLQMLLIGLVVAAWAQESATQYQEADDVASSITGRRRRKPTPTPAPPLPPTPPTPAPPSKPVLGYRPHIVYILADDFGHYNMGWRGNKEFRTPNMDALVHDGIILDRMYVYKYCSPTRSSLLSGRLPIHVNERNGHPTEANYGIDVRMTIIAEKMKEAGYATHQVGKWNVGSLAWGQIPTQRGFDTSYGYMSGEETHYTQHGDYGTISSSEDWDVQENSGKTQIIDLWENDGPAYGKNGTYNAFHFSEHAVDIIEAHNPATPFFLYLAWQNTHTPNEVPEEFLGPKLEHDRQDNLRQTYEGMTHCLDNGIGNVTDALKRRGMWDQTLVIFSSDNGGRTDNNFGGNNYPLRGQKFSDYEGGVRVASFAAGGVIPKARRGTTEQGLIHVCDWHATFCALAGVDPTDKKKEASKLPAIDSINVWPVVSSGAVSPRTVIPLSTDSIIVWPHKLVIERRKKGKGYWTSPMHPNETTIDKDEGPTCPKGCVFDVSKDPNEYVDLAASMPELLKKLTALLDSYVATKFQTSEIPGYDNCTTIEDYAKAHQGFGGPLCHKKSVTHGNLSITWV